MSKVIISCAVTGAVHTPTMSPHLPVTPDEIAAQAIEAAEAGASVLHLHARDPETGKPTPDPDVFMQFLPRIKQASDAVIKKHFAARAKAQKTATLSFVLRRIGMLGPPPGGLAVWSFADYVSLEPFEREGWVRASGDRWRARSAAPLACGDRARIVAVEGLLLVVEPEVGKGERI